mgnify:CR=1 FL=1
MEVDNKELSIRKQCGLLGLQRSNGYYQPADVSSETVRSVKYEEVYLKDYQVCRDAREGLEKYFLFYNTRRYHQSLEYKTPYKSMTYNGVHPVVRFIDNSYVKGVKLKAQQRRLCEMALCRLHGLRKWFISIDPFSARQICPLLE